MLMRAIIVVPNCSFDYSSSHDVCCRATHCHHTSSAAAHLSACVDNHSILSGSAPSKAVIAWGGSADKWANARQCNQSMTRPGSGGTMSPPDMAQQITTTPWVHPALDPNLTEHQFMLGDRRIGGPCGSLHRGDSVMYLSRTSFWSQPGLRWSECRKCGIVLKVWTSTATPVYRWTPVCVTAALLRQKDADPGYSYTTGETVKKFCEQCRFPGSRWHAAARAEETIIVSFVGNATEDILPLDLPCDTGLPSMGVAPELSPSHGHGTDGQWQDGIQPPSELGQLKAPATD